MSAVFPKRKDTDVTAELGVNTVSSIINDDFGWVFRRSHEEHDYGIDGYIDYVTEDGCVTGKFIAVQIKTGASYLSGYGDMFWYRDSKEHLNYYLNLAIPVLIILCDPKSKACYWSLLKSERVELTDKGWKFPVPRSQKLSLRSKNEIEQLFSDSEDHVSLLEQDIFLMDLINNHSIIQYSVPREDIESGNISNLKDFLNKLTRTEKLVLNAQGKTCISVYGYESDKRELFHIREVRRWAKKARRKIDEWYLFTNEHPKLSTLKWVASCTCKNTAEFKMKPDGNMGYLIVFDSEDLSEFLEECFEGLNKACQKWGWSLEYNKDISQKISIELVPDAPYEPA